MQDDTEQSASASSGGPHDSVRAVLGEVLRLALPNIVAAASVTIMHFVDVRMVSRVGKAELAAVSNAVRRDAAPIEYRRDYEYEQYGSGFFILWIRAFFCCYE